MPATAEQSCVLTMLPIGATRFDFDVAFDARGAEILECDVKRQLAVDVHKGEHADEDGWLGEKR